MSETQPVLASAVVIPDAAPESPPLVSAKRRQSSVSESGSKRPRLSVSGEVQSPPRENGSVKPTEEEEDRPQRRRARPDEERKRGQRLFGALLGTLSQSTTTTAQKRRAEIEKRQHAKLRQKTEEDDQKVREKLAKLTNVRRKEQKKFDEQSMRFRHSNMLAMANFLQTTTEPRLYYKPWDLLPREKNRISRQIEEAEQKISREQDDFNDRQRGEHDDDDDDENHMDMDMHQTDDQATSTVVGQEADEPVQKPPDVTNGHANTDSISSELNPPAANMDDSTQQVQEEDRDANKDIVDDAGDGELEQGEEDTVLY